MAEDQRDRRHRFFPFELLKKIVAYRRRRRHGSEDADIPDDGALSPQDPSRNAISSLSRLSRTKRQAAEPRNDVERVVGESYSDPLGLQVVYRPPQSRSVDVILVHGLGGASRRTWSKYGNPDLFWPAKFLPVESGIKEARILTFGYNSNFRPGSGKNTMTILDFAKDLLNDMKYAMDEDSQTDGGDLRLGERPIIFIVHSMGGLIVKEACIQGQNDPAYTEIIKSVSSIIFLSTPHRGTNLAEALNRILRATFVTSPMQFIAELAAGSQTLEKLNEGFRHIAPKLQVVSFYETRPTSIAGTQVLVLDKDSSILGYPGEISRPLYADHHGVCKFEGPNDPTYVAVRNVLKSLVGKAQHSNVENGTKDAEPTLRLNFRDYLSVRETADSDYSFFHDRWVPGTCQWILDYEEFTRWLEDQSRKPHVLWIHGDAASGKSVLSSFIIERLAQRKLPCHYFFIRFLDQRKRTINSPNSIIRLFSELSLTNNPLRVLFVGRKTRELSSAFLKLGKQIHVESIRTEGNTSDLKAYLAHEMDLAGEDTYLDEISSKLLDRAQGNFLWLHLAVQKINSCYTRQDVERAMELLPSGMEALYDRMALSMQSQAKGNNRLLGLGVLGWVACAQRPMTAEELSDALVNDGILDIHRTIGDLCGGFVTVDHEGRVAMVHETAREYLTKSSSGERSLIIDQISTNYQLLERCIACLMDPMLRSQVSRNQQPALLHYAAEAWFVHFAHSSAHRPDALEAAMKFLRGPHVLTWIHFTASQKELRILIAASRHIMSAVLKLRAVGINETLTQHRAIDDMERWATDLIKIVSKFGHAIKQYPESIYQLIPPFCPEDSVVYQQFGRKESRALRISGVANKNWDDCLTRFTLDKGEMATSVIAAGNRIAVLSNVGKTGHITVYGAAIFEEQRRVIHPERVSRIQFDKLGALLVSYGYISTRIWDMATGECLKVIKNPPKRPQLQTLLFSDDSSTILQGSVDKCVRSCLLHSADDEWTTKAQFHEQTLENATLSFPTCSALSPGGNMIAFGYRSYPITCWELEPSMLLGQCMKIQGYETNEVFQLAWHPLKIEIIGLNQVGLLFKWDPYEEESNMAIHTGAGFFSLNQDGSLIATGNAVGTIKILATTNFSLLFRLSTQDMILCLSFSTDSRRIYDAHGTYITVWEPDILVRLADSSEDFNHNGDVHTENESLNKSSLNVEHHAPRINNVVSLAGQPSGPMYCYGTEDGVAILGEVRRGPVCELERMKSQMSIEEVAWSNDGQLVGLLDLARRLFVKRVTETDNSGTGCQVQHEFDIIIPSSYGYITQLVFHPAGSEILTCTATTLFSVNLTSQVSREAQLLPTKENFKWLCHPVATEYLLGFGTTSVRVFDWVNLQEVAVYKYSPPTTLGLPTTTPTTLSLQQIQTCFVGALLSNADSPHVLLQICHSKASGQAQYLVFDTTELQLESASSETETGEKEISYTSVPLDVSSRIREPLGFLSHQRLVFLDVDRWICTWRLPTSHFANGDSPFGIERYYFLPGDWVVSGEANLATITSDGTLLFPRDGAVATVQYSKLRREPTISLGAKHQ
ncbi:hypothetical protein O1611_g2472 [Lasiodiplodia mahajangana]|uniref:Uncharacterized protein n=1 Tax=Lasiodiplodia mahajangana TaxID=1108764 RepID=A0ACC2JUD8_9PEZI|nr:hypothetical protein O1611_g2472 [Lasiodiplodia mahajangana]